MALFMNVVRIVGVTADSFDRIKLFFKVWGDGVEEYSKDGMASPEPGVRNTELEILFQRTCFK